MHQEKGTRRNFQENTSDMNQLRYYDLHRFVFHFSFFFLDSRQYSLDCWWFFGGNSKEKTTTTEKTAVCRIVSALSSIEITWNIELIYDIFLLKKRIKIEIVFTRLLITNRQKQAHQNLLSSKQIACNNHLSVLISLRAYTHPSIYQSYVLYITLSTSMKNLCVSESGYYWISVCICVVWTVHTAFDTVTQCH